MDTITREVVYTVPHRDNAGFVVGYRCPVCNKFFNKGHSAREPKYCEDCGSRLIWRV